MLQTDITTPNTEMQELATHKGRTFNQIKSEYMSTLISVHFDTGRKTHAGTPGSSVALCGGWMRHNGLRYRMYVQPDCKRCIKALEARA